MTAADTDLYVALGVVLQELDTNGLECRPSERWEPALETLRREHRRLGKQMKRVKRIT